MGRYHPNVFGLGRLAYDGPEEVGASSRILGSAPIPRSRSLMAMGSSKITQIQ